MIYSPWNGAILKWNNSEEFAGQMMGYDSINNPREAKPYRSKALLLVIQ